MKKIIDSEILICPECGSGKIAIDQNMASCDNCCKKYPKINGKFIFLNLGDEKLNDPLDKIKYLLKRFSKYYNFLIYLISPVYVGAQIKKFIKNYVSGRDYLAINLGSGNSVVSDEFVNIDMFNYENVDLVCDIEKLPFKKESVDAVLNIAVLEHVPNPEKVVDEINRVLKKNGLVCCFFPFIQGYHASPFDFSRRTYEGMKAPCVRIVVA